MRKGSNRLSVKQMIECEKKVKKEIEVLRSMRGSMQGEILKNIFEDIQFYAKNGQDAEESISRKYLSNIYMRCKAVLVALGSTED